MLIASAGLLGGGRLAGTLNVATTTPTPSSHLRGLRGNMNGLNHRGALCVCLGASVVLDVILDVVLVIATLDVLVLEELILVRCMFPVSSRHWWSMVK